MKKGFDARKYEILQGKAITKRLDRNKRIYLEVGGKLLVDNHASRVLPGYNKKAKQNILRNLSKKEAIYCFNAKKLEENNLLSNGEPNYKLRILKDLEKIKKEGIINKHVVVTRYLGQKKAQNFLEELEKLGKKVYFHNEIKNYAKNLNETLMGYKKQPYIPVQEKIIIVTGPASGSGKMAVIMSQLNHEYQNGIKATYSKYETFPIKDLLPNHPINLAYEAATADLQDINMIDPYHKRYYGLNKTNYNRDIENYAILQKIIKKITHKKYPFDYKSPTDMGINTAGQCIIDEDVCIKASIKEINRRNIFYKNQYKIGKETKDTVIRMNEIIKCLDSWKKNAKK
ncbi:MAG: DUF1846 domain-containing protein [Nanoarchaeota archaeon]